MDCWKCEKTKSKKVCGACRDVLKIDLVNHVLGMDRVYIDELNRHNGRPRVVKDDHLKYHIWELYQELKSCRKVEKRLQEENKKISKSTIHKVIKDYMKYRSV